MLVIFFLSNPLLVIVANTPSSWGDLSALAVIHLLLFTALVWAHGAHGLLSTDYGSRMQNLAASIVFIDAAFPLLEISYTISRMVIGDYIYSNVPLYTLCLPSSPTIMGEIWESAMWLVIIIKLSLSRLRFDRHRVLLLLILWFFFVWWSVSYGFS